MSLDTNAVDILEPTETQRQLNIRELEVEHVIVEVEEMLPVGCIPPDDLPSLGDYRICLTGLPAIAAQIDSRSCLVAQLPRI
ncbi:hypothetical protein [Neptunomonas qingdaonensis]|uniref:hypothetical protein n=1 Tax=Neptunomonas qingdaonensis TaxID=1045558 RepID=UPI001160A635|nr:hypothetical protein [Neptunomonas qingdaonensis]